MYVNHIMFVSFVLICQECMVKIHSDILWRFVHWQYYGLSNQIFINYFWDMVSKDSVAQNMALFVIQQKLQKHCWSMKIHFGRLFKPSTTTGNSINYQALKNSIEECVHADIESGSWKQVVSI